MGILTSLYVNNQKRIKCLQITTYVIQKVVTSCNVMF